MPILNMVGGGNKGGNIGEPLNLTVTSSWLDATITWEDNEIGTIPPTSFAKSELVRKIGSVPTSPSDGTLVVTETVKDTYKVSGYVDQGLTDGTTYYYRVFSYSDLGGISYCDAESVTVSSSWQPGVDTVAYYQFDNNLNDSSGNSYNFTMKTGTPTYGTASGGAKYIHFTQGTYTNNLVIPYTTSAYTINVRLKYDGTNKCFIDVQPQTNSQWWNRCGYISSTSLYMCSGSGATVTGLDLTNWINAVVVLNGSTAETYINGVLKTTVSITQEQTTANYFRLNTVGYGGTTSVYTNNSGNNYMSELILESKTWTAQEILDYYNNTKANYGIS